jgi:IS1 family transposase
MDKREKKIRTKAWVNYVASCVSLSSFVPGDIENANCPTLARRYGLIVGRSKTSRVHLIERNTGVLAQNWSRYRTGERDVGRSTLKRVEQRIPGSMGVYDIGPDGVALWSALWSKSESELWAVAKSISEDIRFHQAWNSSTDNVCDYLLLERTREYFSALGEYFEGLLESSNIGLLGMRSYAALIAAFRLGQFRREAASYQDFLGGCIEMSLRKDSSVVNILRGYGLEGYISNYVDKLIPHPEKDQKSITMIDRQYVISSYLSGVV